MAGMECSACWAAAVVEKISTKKKREAQDGALDFPLFTS
jgi:hypothetical protein